MHVFILYKELPEKEKARFENMAKKEKGRMRGKEGDRYRMDTHGNFIAVSYLDNCDIY